MATSRIEFNPKVMMGKPVIKGTRITVEIILKKLSQNLSAREIMKDYPELKMEDIKEAVRYAASTLHNEDVYIVSKKQE